MREEKKGERNGTKVQKKHWCRRMPSVHHSTTMYENVEGRER